MPSLNSPSPSDTQMTTRHKTQRAQEEEEVPTSITRDADILERERTLPQASADEPLAPLPPNKLVPPLSYWIGKLKVKAKKFEGLKRSHQVAVVWRHKCENCVESGVTCAGAWPDWTSLKCIECNLRNQKCSLKETVHEDGSKSNPEPAHGQQAFIDAIHWMKRPKAVQGGFRIWKLELTDEDRQLIEDPENFESVGGRYAPTSRTYRKHFSSLETSTPPNKWQKNSETARTPLTSEPLAMRPGTPDTNRHTEAASQSPLTPRRRAARGIIPTAENRANRALAQSQSGIRSAEDAARVAQSVAPSGPEVIASGPVTNGTAPAVQSIEPPQIAGRLTRAKKRLIVAPIYPESFIRGTPSGETGLAYVFPTDMPTGRVRQGTNTSINNRPMWNPAETGDDDVSMVVPSSIGADPEDDPDTDIAQPLKMQNAISQMQGAIEIFKEYEGELTEARERNNKVKADNVSLVESNRSLYTQVSELHTQLRQKETEVEQLRFSEARATSDLEKLAASERMNESERAAAQKTVRDLQSQVKRYQTTIEKLKDRQAGLIKELDQSIYDRQDLQEDFEEVTTESEKQKIEIQTLTALKKEQADRIAKFMIEIAALKTESKTDQSSHDDLVKENAKHLESIQRLTQQNSELRVESVAEKAALEKRIAELSGINERRISEKSTLLEERYQLNLRQTNLVDEKDQLNALMSTLKGESSAQLTKISHLESENVEHRQSNERVTADLQSALSQLSILRLGNEKLNQDLTSATAALQTAQQHREADAKHIAHLTEAVKDRQAVEGGNRKLQRQLKEAEAAKEKIEGELKEMIERELKEQIGQLQTGAKAEDGVKREGQVETMRGEIEGMRGELVKLRAFKRKILADCED